MPHASKCCVVWSLFACTPRHCLYWVCQWQSQAAQRLPLQCHLPLQSSRAVAASPLNSAGHTVWMSATCTWARICWTGGLHLCTCLPYQVTGSSIAGRHMLMLAQCSQAVPQVCLSSQIAHTTCLACLLLLLIGQQHSPLQLNLAGSIARRSLAARTGRRHLTSIAHDEVCSNEDPSVTLCWMMACSSCVSSLVSSC